MFVRKYEFWIAFRYLFASKKTGGISVMTIISFLGISLAVFALVVTLAVRKGFKEEFLSVILGAYPHVTVLPYGDSQIYSPDVMIDGISELSSVQKVFPVINEKLVATSDLGTTGADLYGVRQEDLQNLDIIANADEKWGNLDLSEGKIAVGKKLADTLGLSVGDVITLVSPNGIVTPFGRTPLVEDFEISYLFKVGRQDVDLTRVYMDIEVASDVFSYSGVSSLHVYLNEPSGSEIVSSEIVSVLRNLELDENLQLWTWKDASGAFLAAIKLEDNAMFIILGILVLISVLNIVSGLIMLVKNKTSEIGILRTMGYTVGSINRVFLVVGASIGVSGTVVGIIMGVLFCNNIDLVLNFLSYLQGYESVADMVGSFGELKAIVQFQDVAYTALFSMVLSFVVTYFPARKASKISPVEALKNG